MKEAEKKAEEIIDKYSPYCEGNDYDLGAERKENAKQCALNHVEGIIESHKETYYNSFGQQRNNRTINFYLEVKTIIENK